MGLRVEGREPVPSWRKAEPLISQVQTLHCSSWVQEKVRVPGLIGPGKEEPELL